MRFPSIVTTVASCNATLALLASDLSNSAYPQPQPLQEKDNLITILVKVYFLGNLYQKVFFSFGKKHGNTNISYLPPKKWMKKNGN